MEAALYDPAGGFYARGTAIGHRGAYATAPTRIPRFAAAVAAEARDAHAALGAPRAFALVEGGPGDGTLAAALAAQLRGVASELVLVERAAGMRERQRSALSGSPIGVRVVEAADEVRAAAGVVVANELLDALPVHLLEWPREVCVGVDADGRLREVLRPPPPWLADAARVAIGEPVEEGRYAVCPGASAMLEALAGCIEHGRLLLLDYGGEGGEVHGRRTPVRTYVGGLPAGDPLQAPGRQDITADVDFGALRRAAAALGLRELRYGDQGPWVEELAPLAPAAPPWERAARLAALAGFRVLVLEKA